jgi:hypothetical protein
VAEPQEHLNAGSSSSSPPPCSQFKSDPCSGPATTGPHSGGGAQDTRRRSGSKRGRLLTLKHSYQFRSGTGRNARYVSQPKTAQSTLHPVPASVPASSGRSGRHPAYRPSRYRQGLLLRALRDERAQLVWCPDLYGGGVWLGLGALIKHMCISIVQLPLPPPWPLTHFSFYSASNG